MIRTLAITMMALALMAAPASAEVILVNFGGIDGSPDNAASNGELTHWNQAVLNGTLSSVVDSDGNALSGVSIVVANMTSAASNGNLDNDGTKGAYAASGSVPAWLDTDAIEMTNWTSGSTAGTVEISGLTAPGYTVDLIAARRDTATYESNTGYFGTYKANGALNGTGTGTSEQWHAAVDGWQNGGVMTWSNVAPDGDGKVTVSTEKYGDTSFRYFTAMRLTAVPEPVSLALISLGSLCLIPRRRA